MTKTETGARERILSRIRSGLAVRAIKKSIAPESLGPWFCPSADLLTRFQAECAADNTECIVTENSQATADTVADVLSSLPPGEIYLQDAPALRLMTSLWQRGRSLCWSSEGRAAETSQATITLAEALVAETGSVLVSSASGGRGASVIAPVHIVVAQTNQLVSGVGAALQQLREGQSLDKISFACLITGSSRTADIEKILVLGAHGPRRLVVVVEQSGCSS